MRTASDLQCCLFGALLGAAACSEPPQERPFGGDAGSARVVLGMGLDAYEPIEGEPQVPLISGLQGGFHVWASFAAYGFDTDVLRMELTTELEGEPGSRIEMSSSMAVRPGVDAEGQPMLFATGWPAIVFNPRCAHGKRLQLLLTVYDPMTAMAASDSGHCIVELAEAFRASDCPGSD